jgi:hypothetical protein
LLISPKTFEFGNLPSRFNPEELDPPPTMFYQRQNIS